MQDEAIRTAFDRKRRTVSLRPAVGRGTAVTRVRRRPDLARAIEDGPWRLTASMAPRHGGSGEGPDPGGRGRGALGACLALACARLATVR